MDNLCFNCFSNTNGFDVCPHCGFLKGTPNSPEFVLQPGTRLWGRYLIGTVLGIGGFGITYKAFDTRLSSVIAIKEFFPQNLASRIPGEGMVRLFSGENAKNYQINMQRFIEEGKNLAKFTGDAHIVNVFDTFEDNNTAYIVMEFLDGLTLKEYILQNGGALSQEFALNVLQGLLQGIKSIHLKGIIHRDISPDNIYILKDARIKILDFGAARFAAKDEWTQSVVVKKGYAPPEQYRNNMRQTESTDLYAAGATYYKMLTGKTPEESIERWVKDTLVRPSKLASAIDEQTDKFIMKSMALKPELRFKNADEMLSALMQETVFDYPENELKKIKRRQFIAVFSAAVMVFAVVGFSVWGFSNVGAPPPEIIEIDETLADMQIKADTIVFEVSESDNANNVYDNLAAEFMQLNPNYEIVVQTVPGEVQNSSADMALGKNAFSQNAQLMLLTSGLDANLYYNMGEGVQLGENASSATAMPIGFEMFVCAVPSDMASDENYNIANEINSMQDYWRIVYQTVHQTLEIYEFIEIAEFYLPALLDKNNAFTPDGWQADVQEFAQFNLRTGEIINSDDGRIGAVDLAEGFYNGKILSTYTKGDAFYQFNTINAKILPYLSDGKARANSENYLVSVNANSSENKQLIAMSFIHYILSDKGQNTLHVQNPEGALPLNKTAMQALIELYPEIETLQAYFDYERYDNTNFSFNNLDEEFLSTLEKASYINNNNQESIFEIKMFVVKPGMNGPQSTANEDFVDEVVSYFMGF